MEIPSIPVTTPAAARFAPVSLAALAARWLPPFTAFATFFFSNGIKKKASAQTDEGANEHG